MRHARCGYAGLAVGLLTAGFLGGCPTETTTDVANGRDTPEVPTSDRDALDGGITAQTALDVTKTSVPVRFDASLEVGDDLIVFGTGNLTGVAYVVPTAQPTAATLIPGDFRNAGFRVAGTKILLCDDRRQLTVYDTTSRVAVPVPLEAVYLAALPDRDNEDRWSPVAVTGTLAVTINEADRVTDGRSLKLVDVSGSDPVVTALVNPPAAVTQVVLDDDDDVAIARGGDQFFIYDATTPALGPWTLDLSLHGGIAGPFAYDDGYIVYTSRDDTSNLRVLNAATGETWTLGINTEADDLPLAVCGDRYVCFADRDENDFFSVVRRAIVGTPTGSAVEGGVPGDDPRDNLHPWSGFGSDVAVCQNGRWIFISGDEAIDTTAEYLQVSTGGAFQAFADGKGFLPASDVVANDRLVAFKTGAGENTTLAYIVLP
jgi:hypothetical protein